MTTYGDDYFRKFHTGMETCDFETCKSMLISLMKNNENINKYLKLKTVKHHRNFLHLCVLLNDINTLTKIIKMESNLDDEDIDGYTVLGLAVVRCRFDIIKVLLKTKMNFSNLDKTGNTPLHHAIAIGQTQIVDLFLKSGVSVNLKNKYDYSPLHFAIIHERYNIVKLLCSAGADLTCQNDEKVDPLHVTYEDNGWLHLAAKHNDLDLIRFGLNAGLTPSQLNRDKFTPLSLALIHSDIEIVKLLADEKSCSITDSQGNRPLHLAVMGGEEDAVIVILEHCSDVNHAGTEGSTALHIAVQQGNYPVFKLLIRSGADINKLDDKGNSPLKSRNEENESCEGKTSCEGKIQIFKQAIESEDDKILNLLLVNGVQRDCQDDDGRTALHLAVNSGRLEYVKLVVDAGLSTSIVDNDGYSPLHSAVINKNEEIVEILLENDVDKDALDDADNTPLHHAVKLEHYEIMAALIKAGASLKIQNKDKVTPMTQVGDTGLKLVEILALNKDDKLKRIVLNTIK